MSPEAITELSPEQIDSLIEDMQQNAEEGKEGYTDEQFDDLNIRDLITVMYRRKYIIQAPLQGNMYTRITTQEETDPRWKKADSISAGYGYQYRKTRFYITTKVREEKTKLPFYNTGNCRILEGPNHVCIQITSQDPQTDRRKFEIFITKNDWNNFYLPEDLAITIRVHKFILQSHKK